MDYGRFNQAVQLAAQTAIASGSYQRYSGEYCDRLASDLGERLQTSQVLLACSGTAAMEIALRAAGVVAGDEVLLSAYDYPGNFWAIERIGARPVLLDIEPHGWRIAAAGLQQVWREAGSYKALLVSHLHGQLQSMAELRSECDRLGIVLIEDACQAVGASIDGRPAGSFGHASIISFGGGKTLSAGRGGALLSNDPALAQRAKIFSGGGSGPYSLSELQAAVVGAQLTWLDDILTTCRNYFETIVQCLQTSNDVLTPFAADLRQTSFYQAGFLLPPLIIDSPDDQANTRQQTTIARLLAQQVPAGIGFAGFQRRSTKRCRLLQPLLNVADVVQRTVTLHHRLAMTQPNSAQMVAQILNDR